MEEHGRMLYPQQGYMGGMGGEEGTSLATSPEPHQEEARTHADINTILDQVRQGRRGGGVGRGGGEEEEVRKEEEPVISQGNDFPIICT